MSLRESFFALKASASLFHDRPEYASVRRRPVLFEIAGQPPVEPLNRDEQLLIRFAGIAAKRNLQICNSRYWADDAPYNLTEVFGTCVQFLDQHNAPLPITTLPPKKDVERFINEVLNSEGPVTVDRQFETLLDIAGNNIAGAANLGMIATRYMSRFSDIRAYPGISINGVQVDLDTSDSVVEELMGEWGDIMSRFEIYTPGRNDGTGDQYYFWTHFFASVVCGDNSISEKLFKKVFKHGNEIMIFAKDRLARRGGTVSSHYEAALIGRNIGLALNEMGRNTDEEQGQMTGNIDFVNLFD